MTLNIKEDFPAINEEMKLLNPFTKTSFLANVLIKKSNRIINMGIINNAKGSPVSIFKMVSTTKESIGKIMYPPSHLIGLINLHFLGYTFY